MVQILTVVIDQRKRIIEETDIKDDDPFLEDGDEDVAAALTLKGPSSEAVARLTDYRKCRCPFRVSL